MTPSESWIDTKEKAMGAILDNPVLMIIVAILVLAGILSPDLFTAWIPSPTV